MSEGAKTWETLKTPVETEETSVVKTALNSTVVDVEKPEQLLNPGITQLCVDNNHFSEEKVKERPPPGVNGSLIFLYAIFFMEFATGWINLNSCPVNILIPIFLIVSGFLGAVAKGLSKIENRCTSAATAILILLNITWHAFGSYEVYKEYQPNYYPEPNNATVLYCNRTAYLMAFWILNFKNSLLFLFILLSACYMLMRGDFKPTKN